MAIAKRFVRNQKGAPAWITSIEITDLFREFTYRITLNDRSAASERLLIIYGENGSGKTTILRLVYHLLSPVTGKGHKSYLAYTQFSNLKVFFNTGTVVSASREVGQFIGPYSLSVVDGSGVLAQALVDITPGAPPAVVPELEPVLNALGSLNLSYYLLSDDRSLDVSAARDSIFWRSIRQTSALSRSEAKPEKPSMDAVLNGALERLSDWMRRKIINAQYAGEQSVNDLYLKVIRKVASEGDSTLEFHDLVQQIDGLTERNEEFEPLGLSARLSLEPIKRALASAPEARRDIVGQIGSLYLESTKNRLDQLQEIRDLMANIEAALNSFFYRKNVKVDPVNGLQIIDSKGGNLSPSVLSSGEKHLLLLVSNVIVAREEQSVFFVDEPELSLNVKWQRKLIPTLLEFSRGGSNQFVFSTHSLEVLAQSQENVFRLAPVEN